MNIIFFLAEDNFMGEGGGGAGSALSELKLIFHLKA